MRLFLTACSLALLLTGCGGEDTPDKPAISLEFPADQGDQSQAAADAQCKPYNKSAKFRGIEKRGEHDVAVFDCL